MSDQESGPRVRRLPSAALWVLQVVLALVFIVVGTAKLAGARQAVEMFDQVGLGQWLRYGTGVAEVAGGLGLLLPPLCGFAALGLCGVMAGAVAAQVALPGSPWPPLTLLALLTVVAVGRWGGNSPLDGKAGQPAVADIGDGGGTR